MLIDIENLSVEYLKEVKEVFTSGNQGYPYKVVITRRIGFHDVAVHRDLNYWRDLDPNYKLVTCERATIVAIRNNNCILFRRTDGGYGFVGEIYYNFAIKDDNPITKFVSVTNSGVPSGIGYSSSFIYILEWEAVIPQYNHSGIRDILYNWRERISETIKLITNNGQ